MSTLHEAARRVVSAWVSTRPAWIEQCNAAVLALDAALKAQPAQEPVATVTECEACFTPDVCQLRGTCDYYTASQMRIAAPPQQPEPAQEPVACCDLGERKALSSVKLPCDVRIGHGTHRKGSSLLALVVRSRSLYQMAKSDDYYGYASRLAVALWEKHYKNTAPQWKPLPDLLGVLTQIDNMTAGLTRQPEPAQEPAAWAHPTQGFVRWRTETIQPEVVASYERAGWIPLSLYTASQPPRPPLTDEEINRLWHDNGAGIDAERFARIARAIERKLEGE